MLKITFLNTRKASNAPATLEEDAFIQKLKTLDRNNRIMELREAFPRLRSGNKQASDAELATYTGRLPLVLMQTEMKKGGGNEITGCPTGYIVLHVNNLPTTAEAEMIRDKVKCIPFTRMTFVGATAHDVKIVCTFNLDKKQKKDEQEQAFKAAYANLHYIYSSQLGMHLDNAKPELADTFPMSADPKVYYNPVAVAYTVMDTSVMPSTDTLPEKRLGNDILTPETAEEWANIYERCHSEAIEKTRMKLSRDDAGYHDMILSLLAQFCAENGVPQELAVTRTLWKQRYARKEDTTRRVFANEYEEVENNKNPLGLLSKPEITARKTRAFVDTKYHIRRNVLSDEVEYCSRNGYDFTFKPLSDSTLNGMSQEARFAGVGSSRQKQDIIEYVQSDLIKRYDPIADWLDALPEWDGTDHVSQLLGRIQSGTPSHEYYMHTWLRSMVAHWLGKDGQYGNAIVPLLIGEQGCGKSTFCARLLPEELRRYYNDNVSFRSEHDLNLNLSSFLLINIDEFDKLKASEQPVLKYLLSKNDVKGRIPYGINIEVRRRYASFIATTNNRKPLTDPTGSRRFVCIDITAGSTIDNTSDINYEQLYAQLVYEINNGARYWFESNENQKIMQQNAVYQREDKSRSRNDTTLVNIVGTLLRRPDKDEEVTPMTTKDIVDILQRRGIRIGTSLSEIRELGVALRANGFSPIRRSTGMFYYLKER